jgi:hypothetical protein
MSAFSFLGPLSVKAGRSRSVAVIGVLAAVAATHALHGSQHPQVKNPIPHVQTQEEKVDLVRQGSLNEAKTAALPGDDHTCFGQQKASVPGSDRVRSSVLFLVVLPSEDDVDNIVARASGFVVADSGHGGRPNRILTARHVWEDVGAHGPDAVLGVVSSSGRFLGFADMVAQAEPRPSLDLGHPERPDIVTLEMVTEDMSAREKELYRAIPGLELAHEQPQGTLRGAVSLPSGVASGDSGSPILDQDMKVRGVLTASGDGAALPGSIEVVAGDILDMNADDSHGFHTKPITMPLVDSAIAEGLPPEILHSLGRAADHVDATSLVSDSKPFSGYVSGYSEGSACLFREGGFQANGDYGKEEYLHVEHTP